jgi:tetratricopeptide (TPR) repeat protein
MNKDNAPKKRRNCDKLHKDRLLIFLISLSLSLLAVFLYAKVGGYEFIELDDAQYVLNNTQVRQGLSMDGLFWAFSSLTRSNWHPLTWLSHMLDVSLFGMDAGLHHLMSVWFHSLSAAFLFLALRRMTGSIGKSAFVAALFAVHPLHVESVAWVAERKDVLSGLFFMLVLLSYERYVRRPGFCAYLAVALFLALGLMAKSMLVTAPLVLLILDIWPLGRTKIAEPEGNSYGNPVPWRRLFLEKVPLFGISIAAALVTLLAQKQSLGNLDILPLSTRAANAALSYVAYLFKLFWPVSLAIPYPYTAFTVSWWNVAGSALLLIALSYVVVRNARNRPYLAVGWLWYLVMLLPVIGLVQVGRQAMADRYTYLPLLGPFIMVTWYAAEAGSVRRIVSQWIYFTGTAMILAALCAATFVQLGYWSNGVRLFSHTLAVTSENADAHKALASALSRRGKYQEAIGHFSAALQIWPDDAETHRNMGLTFAASGQPSEGLAHFREALRINPSDKVALSCLRYYETK